ncbi:hypothetical protein [Micromonospora zhanjiangensis]
MTAAAASSAPVPKIRSIRFCPAGLIANAAPPATTAAVPPIAVSARRRPSRRSSSSSSRSGNPTAARRAATCGIGSAGPIHRGPSVAGRAYDCGSPYGSGRCWWTGSRRPVRAVG